MVGNRIAAILLGSLAISVVRAQSWKEKKRTHQGIPVTSPDVYKQISNDLNDQRDFNRNLDAILIPRTVGSRNHARVRQHIGGVMRNLGWNVEENSFRDQTPHGQKQFTNIIATLDPSAARRLVIACHYDSKIEPAGVYATDSAVPCSMMLNLATTMRDQLNQLIKKRSDLTLQFIFFDGEEAFVRWSSTDSIYGARNLAAKWENQLYTDEGDMRISREEGNTRRWFNRLVSIENNLKRNNLISGTNIFQNRAGGGGIEDDHFPFKRRGVPILHLISAPFPRVWHTVRDDRSALDSKKIENFNKILRVFVAEYLGLDFSVGCNTQFCFLS